jgi:hypothetical protein
MLGMNQQLRRRDLGIETVNSTMVVSPGIDPREDFSLLLGLHTGIMQQMNDNVMIVHRTAEVFGNEDGVEIPAEQAAVLIYDPAKDGLMQMDVVRMAYTSIPEEIRPRVFIPLRLTKAMLGAVFIEGMALLQRNPWVGMVEEDMEDDNQWRACRRILLTQGHDRAEALETLQARLVKDAIEYEGADRDTPGEAGGGGESDPPQDAGGLDVRGEE